MPKPLFKSLLSLVVLSSVTTITLAQRQNVYYFNRYDIKVTNPDSAEYMRIVREPDSGSVLYTVLEYYKDKTPKLTGYSSSIDPVTYQGQLISYYPNGKRRIIAEYKNNHLINSLYNFYPDGKLHFVKQYSAVPVLGTYTEPQIITFNDSTGKAMVIDGNGYYKEISPSFSVNRFYKLYEEGPIKNGKRDGRWSAVLDTTGATLKETYADGRLLTGTFTSKDGITRTYTGERETSPDYKGGMQEFYSYLGHNIRYPVNAFKNKIQGRVIVQFVVEKDGSLTNVKALRSPNEDLAQESVRVISSSPNWIPGKQFGFPVRVQYTVPVQYSLGK